jgi:DNA repair exonuclease SbcCD ATPase subunit
MRIILKNFKCWVEKDLTLKDDGIILLSAKSGKGKSSILDAIFFCLFDGGSKLVTHSKTNCSVTLIIDDMTITRTKRPNHLSLVSDKGEFEDDIAQSIIDNHFGSLFDVVSYVKQNGSNTFLRMTPTEKLEFIERALFQSSNLGLLKEKTRGYVKECNDNLVGCVAKLSTLREMMESQKAPQKIDFPLKVKKEDYPKVEKNENIKKKNNEIYLKRANHELTLLKGTLSHLSMIKDSHRFKAEKISEYSIRLNDLIGVKNKDDIKDIDKRIKLVEDNLKKIDDNRRYFQLQSKIEEEEKLWKEMIQKEKDNLESEIKKIEDEVKNLSYLSEDELVSNKEYLQDLTKYQKLLEDKDNIDFDPEKHCISVKKLEEIKKDFEKISNEIKILEGSKDLYSCPHCSKSIAITEEGLIASDHLVIEDVDQRLEELEKKMNELKKQIKKLEVEVKEGEEKNNRLNYLDGQISEILESYEGIEELDVDETISEIKGEIKETEKGLTRIQNLKRELDDKKIKLNKGVYSDSLNTIRKRLDKMIDELKNLDMVEEDLGDESSLKSERDDLKEKKRNLKSLEEKIGSLENLIQNYQSEIEKEKERFLKENELKDFPSEDEIETKINNKENEIKGLYEKREEIDRILEKISEYNKYITEKEGYDNLAKKIWECEKDEKEFRNLLAGATLLRDKISEAESLSISNFIQTLAVHVNLHLESFFKEDPMLIEIESFKEVKANKGPSKPQINIKIDYKGFEVDINSLSGGEAMRVDLAFTLSLAEIFGSRLLMLDESLGALDIENSEIVMSSLKENYRGKSIIIISHQLNDGMFDEVIKI